MFVFLRLATGDGRKLILPFRLNLVRSVARGGANADQLPLPLYQIFSPQVRLELLQVDCLVVGKLDCNFLVGAIIIRSCCFSGCQNAVKKSKKPLSVLVKSKNTRGLAEGSELFTERGGQKW